jgi:hypothetical protein
MSGEFQNRVRKNLEQAPPAEHPSADALNAYAEHALSSREARDVLQHLAVCAECREIVYLASEAAEETATPVATLPKPRKFRWWTWALPLTAVLVVASVIFVEGPLRKQLLINSEPVQTEISPPQSTDQLAAKTAPTAPPPIAKPAPSPAQPTLKGYVDRAPAATPERRQLPQEQKEEPATVAGSASKNAPLNAAPPSSAPRYLEKDKKSDIAQFNDKTLQANEGTPVSNDVAAAPAAQGAATTAEVTASNAEVTTNRSRDESYQYSAKPEKQRPDSAKKLSAAKAAPVISLARTTDLDASTWSVNPEGRVQHLVNGAWQPVAIDPAAHFLVVAVSGENIWAAGKNLALYHSPDNGAHWQRQSIPAKPGTDIVSIHAANALAVTFTTSASQTFATQDAGQTWKLR